MPTTEAQTRATRKYKKKAYYRPSILFRKELEEPIRSYCEENGVSINELVNQAVKSYIGIE